MFELQNRTSKIKYKEVSKYLGMQKDVAFVFKKGLTNKEIIDVIKKAGGKLLNSIEVFDVYRGENVKENEKSIAYSLLFSDLFWYLDFSFCACSNFCLLSSTSS